MHSCWRSETVSLCDGGDLCALSGPSEEVVPMLCGAMTDIECDSSFEKIPRRECSVFSCPGIFYLKQLI